MSQEASYTNTQKSRCGIDGYLTVEAAVLFPFVTGVILLVIYLLFFQYDRCLMEQSAGVLAMRGCTLQETDLQALVAAVLQQDTGDKPYLAWTVTEPKITAKGDRFIVQREGSLLFPFGGLAFWTDEKVWRSSVRYENKRIHPVSFIRKYKKFAGGK